MNTTTTHLSLLGVLLDYASHPVGYPQSLPQFAQLLLYLCVDLRMEVHSFVHEIV